MILFVGLCCQQEGDLQGAVSKTSATLTNVADNLTDQIKQVRTCPGLSRWEREGTSRIGRIQLTGAQAALTCNYSSSRAHQPAL